jgi:6-methylsalicylate decarboxylase
MQNPDAAPINSRRGVIDVHSHFLPDVYRRALASAGIDHPDGMPGLPPWSEASMLEAMDRIGIETAIMSISSPGIHFGDDAAAKALAREVNLEGARLKAGRPGRFGFFASVPLPDVDGSIAEIAYAFDKLHADGVIIESNRGGTYPGDPAFEPFFAELDRRAAVVLLHPTSPHGPPIVTRPGLPLPILEFMFETTRALTNMILAGTLDRNRNIRLIVPHAGATVSVLIDRVAAAAPVLLKEKAVTTEGIMQAFGRPWYDLAGMPVPRLLPALRSFASPDRLLYGSDMTFTPEPAVSQLKGTLEAFLAAEPELLRKVQRVNAQALFPRFAGLKTE